MNSQRAGNRTVIIAFLAFVGLGLFSGLLGLAWPYMQKQFELPLDGVSTLFLVQTIGYTLVGFSIGRMMARFGSGLTLLAGMGFMTVGLFGIAASPSWMLIVALSLLMGLGSGVVDAGLNLYMATYHNARQMNWLHAFFGVGITCGPLIMTFVLEHDQPWQSGYVIVGVILLLLVLLFAVTRSEWRNEGLQTAENKPIRRASFAQSLRMPVVWLSMLTFLVYVGTEIGIGQWTFPLLTQSRGMTAGMAGPWVSVYWGAFTGGRFFFGIVGNRVPVERQLRLCLVALIVGTALLWWNPIQIVGLLALAVLGFAQAPIFPLLMTDTAERVGKEHAENTISLQMGAVGIGAAILPGLIGTFGKNFGLEAMPVAFLVMAILVSGCYELARIGHTRRVTAPSAGD